MGKMCMTREEYEKTWRNYILKGEVDKAIELIMMKYDQHEDLLKKYNRLVSLVSDCGMRLSNFLKE